MQSAGLNDIAAGFRRWRLALFLAWRDVRQRYRRSILGPFWITISVGVGIATIGFVFSRLFKQSVVDLLPYLSLGIVLWTFMLSAIMDGCSAFTAEEATIKQFPLPLFLHIERVIFRNVLILAHNLVIIPIVFLACGRSLPLAALWSVIGLLVLVANLGWVSLILAAICARYRDIPQIVSNLLQIFFYITPVIWMPSLIEDRSQHWVFVVNPAFHFIEIVRAPMLGTAPSSISWCAAVAILVVGWLVTLVFFNRFRPRVAYWL